jgi:tetratricopeptide (TPR) repeat protein
MKIDGPGEVRDSIPNSGAGSPGRQVPGTGRGIRVLLASILVLLTLAVFFPLRGHDFVGYGDDLWVTKNSQAESGLNVDSIGWAFTSVDGGAWLPLARLSVILDGELFGMNPGGHHLTSLLLHAAAALLLFLALAGMTGMAGRSFLVAALFAVHPLNVEPVAWAAARQDVLVAFFWMLTLFFYHRYALSPGPLRYLALAGVFAFGLMSSPLLAALPLVLLLLDLWPLERLPWGAGDPKRAGGRYPRMPVREVIEEKVPLVALAAVTITVNLFVRGGDGAAVSHGQVSFPLQLAEAMAAGLWYICKALWPAGLAVTYPRPGGSTLFLTAILAAVLLTAVTALAVRFRRRMPAVALGWSWYLSTLVTVLLLAAAGAPFMADRHAGIPLVGLFIMAVWGVASLVVGRIPKRVLQAVAALLLASLAITAGRQVRVWSDTAALLSHALKVNEDNEFAHHTYGNILSEAGEDEEALRHFREALRVDPRFFRARRDLASLLSKLGRKEEALEVYRRAREIDPDSHPVNFSLGSELARQQRYEEAEPFLREALLQRPDHVKTLRNLAATLLRQQKYEEAAKLYRRALSLDPGHRRAERNLGEALVELREFEEAAGLLGEAVAAYPDRARSHYHLGRALQGLGKEERAETSYREALRLQPEYPEAREAWGTLLYGRKEYGKALERFREASRGLPESDGLKRKQGDALLRLGRLEEAEEQYRGALLLNPSNASAHNNLGTVLFKRGHAREAVASYRKALEIDPEFVMATFNLANVLFKSGKAEEAVPFYDRVLELSPEHEKAREYRSRALKSAGSGKKGRGQ